MSIGEAHDGAFAMNLERATLSSGRDIGTVPETEIVNPASRCQFRSVFGERFIAGIGIETEHSGIVAVARSPRIGSIRRDGGPFQLAGPVTDGFPVHCFAEMKMQSGRDAVLIPAVAAEGTGIRFDFVMKIPRAAGRKMVDRPGGKIGVVIPAFPETLIPS